MEYLLATKEERVFLKKSSPPSQKNSGKNDTSFESLNKELLESGGKLGVASFWKLPGDPLIEKAPVLYHKHKGHKDKLRHSLTRLVRYVNFKS